MAEKTDISWTDATFNPWLGCTKVSDGCSTCYAEALMDHRYHRVQWGAGKPRVRTSAQNWNQPKRWNNREFVQCASAHCGWRGEMKNFTRQDIGMVSSCCPSCGNEAYIRARRRVFCASLADVFDNEVDPAWRVDLFKLIRATPNLDWVLLTKRIGNVGRMIVEAEQIARAAGDDLCAWMHRWQCGEPPENLWLGATVVNQQEANRDIPKLLAVAARVRFLSCEPLLERIDLTNIPIGGGHGHHEFDPIITANVMKRGDRNAPHVHWAIVGGESGRSAREFSVDAAREIVRQCQAAGVPVHVKQMGARPVETDVDGLPRKVVYIATAGRDAAEWPEDLRVQEFPKV